MPHRSIHSLAPSSHTSTLTSSTASLPYPPFPPQLIDPYWTIIPPLVGGFYQSHPLAQADAVRSLVCMVLLCVWAARLTHSYFRR